MPVYEYRCEHGHYFDKSEGFDAPRRQPCPICAAPATRQISLPTVIFKGPGFYKTDNRGSSRSDNGKAAEPDTATPSGDGHGRSHREGGHSHGGESAPKAETPTSD